MIFDTETRRIQRRLLIGKKVIVYTADGPHADEIIELINKLEGKVEKSVSKNGCRQTMFDIPMQSRFIDELAYAEKLAISARLDSLLEVSQPTKLFSSDLSTIGGSIIGITDSNNVVYDTNDLPMLVIGGSSETYPITITTNGSAGTYPEQPQLSNIRRPLSLLRINSKVSGEIQVRSRDNRFESFYTGTNTTTKTLFARKITLSVSKVANKYGQQIAQEFNVESLSRRTFTVVAWPTATLDIVVRPEYLAPYTYNRVTCDVNGYAKFECNVDAEVSGNLSIYVAYDSVIKSNDIQFTSSVYCERSFSIVIDHKDLKLFGYSKQKYHFERETQAHISNVIHSNYMITDEKSPGLYVGKLNRSITALENLWVVFVTKKGQTYSAKKVERVITDRYGYFAIPIYGPNLWLMVGFSKGDLGWNFGKSLHTLEIGEVTGQGATHQLSSCYSYIPGREPKLNEVWNAISQEPLASLVPNDLLLVCQAGLLNSFMAIKSVLRAKCTSRMSSSILKVIVEAIPVYEDYQGHQHSSSLEVSALLFSREVSKKAKPCADSIHGLRMRYSEVRNLFLNGHTTTSFGSVTLPDKLAVDEVIVILSKGEYVCRLCGLINTTRAQQKHVGQSVCAVRPCIGELSGSIQVNFTKDFIAAILMNASIFLEAFRSRDAVKKFQSVISTLDKCNIDQDVIEVLNLLESPAEIHKLESLRTKYKHVGMYFEVVNKILSQELISVN